MIFTPTAIAGVVVVEPERQEDDRGFFARTFCAEEFAAHGLATSYVQASISFNARAGTLRGMHFQAAPHEEAKLVRCTRGAVHDVVLDLRRGSPTFLRSIGLELSAENRRTLSIAPGLAHGFLTLTDGAEVFYQMSERYDPENARGVRWNDPAFGIAWGGEVRVISDRDAGYPDFEP